MVLHFFKNLLNPAEHIFQLHRCNVKIFNEFLYPNASDKVVPADNGNGTCKTCMKTFKMVADLLHVMTNFEAIETGCRNHVL